VPSAPLPRIGCSGWNYKSWRGRFYPEELASSRWLSYYAEHFDTVEVNNTFYRLPEAETFAAWRQQVSAPFIMAVKASRFLTHMKRLRDPGEPLQRLFSRAGELGARLGPVLYQLPATLTFDLRRLEDFVSTLPRKWSGKQMRHVIEFRDPSWYVKDVFQVLERYGVALCLHDKSGSEISEPFVGPFAYVRFHGTSGRYHGSYSDKQLEAWAQRLVEHAHEGRRVFAYFNNDPEAVATMNAETLSTAVRTLLKAA
jgi:uncharacterized protein YecE (DUF72 family)